MLGPPRRPMMSSPGTEESQIVSPGPGVGAAGEPSAPLAAATIWQLVKLRSEANPHRILAVDEKGRELYYGQLRDKAEAVAAGLTDIRKPPGARGSLQPPSPFP